MRAHYLVNKIADTDLTPKRQELDELGGIISPVTNIIIMVRKRLVAKKILMSTMLERIY